MRFKKIFVAYFIFFSINLYLFHFNFTKVLAAENYDSGSFPVEQINNYTEKFFYSSLIPALSVVIVDKDEVLFSKSYGECNNNDTPYFLGSVSKSFTALCILRLAQQNKIDLGAPVSKYLPEINDSEKITVNQLLNHTSGLGEYQNLSNVKVINDQGVHHYANVNYTILGELIEKVSGVTYSEYIKQNIFEPLNMDNSSADISESVNNGVIDGYTDYFGIPIKRAHNFPDSKNDWITVPAGYLSSSANDLGKYLQMYLNRGQSVISQDGIEEMFFGDTVYVDGEIPYRYGYGWAIVDEPFTESVIRHSGLIETGTSCLFILPESGLGVVILADSNDYFVSNEMLDRFGWGLIQILLGDTPNEIGEYEYFERHAAINLIMAAVFIISVIPYFFLKRFIRSIRSIKKKTFILQIVLIHIILPVFILLIPEIFFSTPLWVVKSFVPDVFITVVTSAALLFICGIVKCVIFVIHNKR